MRDQHGLIYRTNSRYASLHGKFSRKHCSEIFPNIFYFSYVPLSSVGNKCFRTNEIYGAIEYYTLGLVKSPNDTRILSNRAECYLQGQLPHLALADCERILDIYKQNPTEENKDITFNWKVYYRQMRALIGLQLFDQAKLSADPLVECSPDVSTTHNEIADRFRRILDIDIPRLQSEAEGNYDMYDLLTRRVKRNDEFCAEFERQGVCEFRQCEKSVRYFIDEYIISCIIYRIDEKTLFCKIFG
jgi:tetratricopeptide (TPR) repeat protein